MGKKLLFFLFFFILTLIPGAQADEKAERGVRVLAKDLGSNAVIGKQYLFLIGIDKYKYWFPLKNPVKDAHEIRDILLSRYFIDEVVELYNENATKENIIKTFKDLQEKLKIDDSLLIYYAGHGHLDETTSTGFWIPVNGGTDVFKQENWLPNTQIRGIVTNISASHICLISDSCFSGDILNTSRAMAPEINNEYFKKAYSRTSRQVLTSGASETVPDASEFTQQLKMALLKNKDKFLDPLMIYNQIRLGVETTTPLFGDMKGTGHQEGASFLLFLKEGKNEGTEPENVSGYINLTIATRGRLYIDGEFYSDVQPGNLLLPEIETGNHTLRISYSKEKEETYSIMVEANQTCKVNFTWQDQITPSVPGINEKITTWFSAGLGFGLFIPIGESADLFMFAPFPAASFTYNLKLGWGILGLGILSGANLGSTVDTIPRPFTMTSIPVSACIRYITQFESPFFIQAEISGGVMNNLVMFEDQPDSSYETALALSGGLGAGYKILPNLAVTVMGHYNAIVFKEAWIMGITPALQLELSF